MAELHVYHMAELHVYCKAKLHVYYKAKLHEMLYALQKSLWNYDMVSCSPLHLIFHSLQYVLRRQYLTVVCYNSESLS